MNERRCIPGRTQEVTAGNFEHKEWEMKQLDTLLRLLGTSEENLKTDTQEQEKFDPVKYVEAVKSFLAGQDFLRLGRNIQGHQWHLVLSNSARLKTHCNELGITCFDIYIAGIRAAARHQDTNEALQLMSRITARRVQLRNLLAEEKEKCDM